MDNNTRVRFAPSPTGNIHIGNVRASLLNWLYAKNTGGKYILRIEDTDEERSTTESEKGIVEQLAWIGLDWDEGPVKGGDFGPYRQSERSNLYKEHAEKLLASGNAYKCYCTAEELEEDRQLAKLEKRPPGYNGKCRNLKDAERDGLEASGRTSKIRFKVPGGSCVIEDLVQGNIRFEYATFSDFVIVRESGVAMYNFAVVVDDALMKITTVIRGNDHVSNTPKQVMIYEALGYAVPKFAHMPMITGQDGVRLSKRHGHTSLEEFKDEGYLPEALINYLSLLSWSSETGDEILNVDRLIAEFDFGRMSKSPAAFDIKKLNWMNGLYIREMDAERTVKLAMPYMEKAGYVLDDAELMQKIIMSVRDNVDNLSQFPSYAAVYFKDALDFAGDELEMVNTEDSQKVYVKLLEEFGKLDEVNKDNFGATMKIVQTETGVKGKNLWMPVRVALTGQMHGPELPVVLDILGIEKCKALLGNVIK